MGWIYMADKPPPRGVPVLIVAAGVTQWITYMLDSDEQDEVAWFEPYGGGFDDNVKLPIKRVSAWMALPVAP